MPVTASFIFVVQTIISSSSQQPSSNVCSFSNRVRDGSTALTEVPPGVQFRHCNNCVRFPSDRSLPMAQPAGKRFQCEQLASESPPSLSTFEDALHDAHIPGLVAIVVDKNGILYDEAIGYHSPIISNERRAMDSEKSIFVLASISKTFIVVAVMQLVEEQRVNLDIDINTYLSPAMKIRHPLHPNVPITLRHLLSHTAGIKSNFEEELRHYQPDDDFVKSNLSETIAKYLDNKSNWWLQAPGEITEYSNIGVSVAALVVENVTNTSFEQYVQDRILRCLGIKAGYRISDFANRKQNLVEHFIYNASWLEQFHNLVPQLNISRPDNSSDWLNVPQFGAQDYPAGSLRMSARSLTIFLHSFLNNFSLLLRNTSSVDEMLRIVRHEQSDVEYGLIWNWRVIHGRRLVGHRGAIPGVTNIMMANEARTLGIIILSNGDISKSDDQSKRVYETIIHIMSKLFDYFEK
ncbi:unnamed protein product [Adineta ricciae]|uniref:Beta-lactamase-related domain-containing protein n=1 Tax=Adineta ricciae TaxID=249248 RepID=A0A813NR76_ADIRI|nr:unnamed protein product [Adineta ricciae]